MIMINLIGWRTYVSDYNKLVGVNVSVITMNW